ncbi:S-layer family protein [Chamaesiphon sp. VAR_48_metabat_135_sub]|uniref:S-layer family protein n=1 Tax=Chamaesiphon sp. VAR_48_metabat_135_sub TaxID=2964699 RepID=UPI00286A898E|nr:S-layer family protein [Chamaesiphon sp. VAR_48_metabat_135_sub]
MHSQTNIQLQYWFGDFNFPPPSTTHPTPSFKPRKSYLYLILLILVNLIINIQTTVAQTYRSSNRIPVPDNTLGTKVSGVNNNFNITGGLSKGQTLFHSFSDFSVPTNGQANFYRPAGNRDIIARVTGGLFSDIDGLINTNGANFFLINPQGVIFGPNARLNVGKAFIASTADGIDLVDAGGKTYNFGVSGAGDAPLIKVNANVLFNPNKLIMGGNISGTVGIVNYGTLKTKNDNQYIGLIGGNVTLDGRYGGGKIVAPGGRVDLGGVNSAGTITIDDRGLVGSNGVKFGDVSLINGGQVTVRADRTLGTVNTFFNNVTAPGSSINISANNLKLTNDRSTNNKDSSSLDAGLAINSGIKTATGGSININSTGNITLDNAAHIKNTISSQSGGKIGDIKIVANSVALNNGSKISTRSNGTGNAGNIDIQTAGNLTISGTDNPNLLTGNDSKALSQISAVTNGKGNSGKISIKAGGDVKITNLGGIFAGVEFKGIGYSKGIEIAARNLSLTNTSQIAAGSSGQGNAGNIDITTSGNLTISGTDNPKYLTNDNQYPLSNISTQKIDDTGDTGKITIKAGGDISINNRGALFAGKNDTGTGDSKGIEIHANNFSLTNFSHLYASNNGVGKGGNIDITTIGNIIVSGTDNLNFVPKQNDDAVSTIETNTDGKGDTGKITINAGGDFSVKNLGGIYAAILPGGRGDSKGIDITARNLKLENYGFIQTVNDGGKGDTGDINIKTKGTIDIVNLSRISSRNKGSGKANDISITANRINLDKGEISTNSNTDSGGNISLNLTDLLLLRNDSKISTNSESLDKRSNGGNITINSPLIVALPGNNDITANAYNGTGGKVNITSKGLFGIQYRPNGQDSFFTNDITASSKFGSNGIVNINTPGTDPAKDKGELPEAPNDVSKQISQACGASQRDNKFYITGRGGLPPNALEPQESDALWEDARAVQAKPATIANLAPKYSPPAIGWEFEQNGRVRLIAAQTGVGATGTRVVCPNR